MSRNGDFKNQRVLLVEDDAELRSSLEMALRELAFEVDSASDGKAALAKIKEGIYDILITDLRLPHLSGDKVLCQAKLLYPDLIVIVITGYGDVSNAVNTMKLGATDYVQKPFLKEELILRLRKALEERQLRWQNRTLEQQTPESQFCAPK